MNFIETYAGVLFEPLRPNFANIQILDIAHALSNQCRFSGHTRVHYSVAEHSVRVSRLLRERGYRVPVQLWGLLHDASEAYLVDLATPIKHHKRFGAAYRKAEVNLMGAVCQRFGLASREPAAVCWADRKLLATEVRDLMPGRAEHWKKLRARPLPERIIPWGCFLAKVEFLNTFTELTGVKT